ncbi:unnamed protein product [Effrenium voratum]|nr:unnamed protein product [Effrenium voratum]
MFNYSGFARGSARCVGSHASAPPSHFDWREPAKRPNLTPLTPLMPLALLVGRGEILHKLQSVATFGAQLTRHPSRAGSEVAMPALNANQRKGDSSDCSVCFFISYRHASQRHLRHHVSSALSCAVFACKRCTTLAEP